MPSLATLKLIGYAAAGLALAALLAFGFFTVKGWHDDAGQLPVVKAQLTESRAAYAALDKSMTRRLDGIAGALADWKKHHDQVDDQISTNQAAIHGDVETFLRRYADALKDPRCAVPQSVRDGLRALFPAAPGGKPGPAGGGGQGAGAAGPAAAPKPRSDLPGQQRAANFGGKMGMSTAAGRGGSPGNGQPGGAGGAPDRGAAGRDRSALPAARLGFLAKAAAAVALIGAAAVQLARDDRPDA